MSSAAGSPDAERRFIVETPDDLIRTFASCAQTMLGHVVADGAHDLDARLQSIDTALMRIRLEHFKLKHPHLVGDGGGGPS